MDEELSTPLIRRRKIVLGSLGAAALAFVGLTWPPRQVGIGQPGRDRTTANVTHTLLAFTGALMGRNLSEPDRADLSDRLQLFMSDETLRHDCSVLARHLDDLARKQRAMAFASCSPSQQERIVEQVVLIDPLSMWARVLQRLSRNQRDFYRMRWSTVTMLAWIYRHSPAAWRARGYTRWPGVAGDWRETLAPGAPYP